MTEQLQDEVALQQQADAVMASILAYQNAPTSTASAPPVPRARYSISFNELLSRLGIDGHITRLWTDPNMDYLEFHVEPGSYDGHWPEDGSR